MAELYGGGAKPEKRKQRKSKKSLKRRQATAVKTQYAVQPGKLPDYLNYFNALVVFQAELKEHPPRGEERFKKILRRFFNLQPETKLESVATFQAIFILKTRIGGHKGYVADFYLPDFNLIIEIDGDSHNNSHKYDKIRDKAFYREKGIRTLRIPDYQTKDENACISILRLALKDKVKKHEQPQAKTKRARVKKKRKKTKGWKMPMKHVKETGPVVKLRKRQA